MHPVQKCKDIVFEFLEYKITKNSIPAIEKIISPQKWNKKFRQAENLKRVIAILVIKHTHSNM